MARPYKCLWYGVSGKSVSKRIRRTKTMGNRALAVCGDCRRKFSGTTSAHPLSVRRKPTTSSLACQRAGPRPTEGVRKPRKFAFLGL